MAVSMRTEKYFSIP